MKIQNGLTLIEMMITLAVAIILVAVGIPAFRSITANNRAVAQSNSLVTALTLARGEAVKRGVPVTICRSVDNACDDAANDWANGWLVFEDTDASNSMDAGEELIRVWDEAPGNPTIVALDDSDNEVHFVRFDPLGSQATAGIPTFTITNPDCRGDQVRAVSVSPTGQVTTTRNACP